MHQELGQLLVNVGCNAVRTAGSGKDSDVYELVVRIPSESNQQNGTGIFVTVAWELDKLQEPSFSTVAVHRDPNRCEQSSGVDSTVFPALPIEELVLSHPLVADAAILRAADSRDRHESTADTRSRLVVFVHLTVGARKYAADSLAAITSFVAKKLPSDDTTLFDRLELVGRIPRDAYGRVVTEMLTARTPRDGSK